MRRLLQSRRWLHVPLAEGIVLPLVCLARWFARHQAIKGHETHRIEGSEGTHKNSAVFFTRFAVFEDKGKNRCRERSSSGSKSRYVSSKNGLFEFYVKIVAESILPLQHFLPQNSKRLFSMKGIASATIFT